MDKTAIRSFAIEARNILRETAKTEAGFYGITEHKIEKPVQRGEDFEVYKTIAGTENRIYDHDVIKRRNLKNAVEEKGFEQVIEETAYTWFNRLIAIRFMEVNDYLPTRVRVLSSETGSNTPDILEQYADIDLNMKEEELDKVVKAKEDNRYDDAFCMLFIKQCNALHDILPGLFEKTDDYMELLLKITYTNDGVVRKLVDSIPESSFNVEEEGQVEIIGWMYQYYNTELKDDTFAKLKKNIKISKERIPAATQLFTPDWIVRYMVENSVGRVWIDHLRANDDTVDEKKTAEKYGWKYYLAEAEQEVEVEKKLVEIRADYKELEPKDITCIDPCMGSGHILVYMFDVLMDIYRSEGFHEREAVSKILKHNIRGLDIDQRAYQLSYFALMMKARGYDKRFFRDVEKGKRKLVEPKVYAIEESNGIDREHLKYFGATMQEEEKQEALLQLNEMLDSMLDAKEYGSILDIKEYQWDLLKEFIRKESLDGQISFDTVGLEVTKKKVKRLIEIASVMARKYYVVSTNPPYMGLSNGDGKLNQYVKKMYPDSKTDLFAVFIERCGSMTKVHGIQAMITQHAWMFLSSYKKLRTKLEVANVVNLVHLGTRAFDEINGEVVQTVSFVFRNAIIQDYGATYLKLTKYSGENEKRKAFLAKNNCYITKSDLFKKLPNNVFAYWISRRMFNVFENKQIMDYGNSCIGMRTGDNERFLRLWYEVNVDRFEIGCNSAEETINSGKKWFPYCKGGTFRKWYGNNDYVVNWENDGYEIKENTKRVYPQLGDNLAWKISNEQYYFHKGITWSGVGASVFGVRSYPNGMIFDSGANSFFVFDEEKYEYFIGLLNTKLINYIIDIINPTINTGCGVIAILPAVYNQKLHDKVKKMVEENINLSKDDWNAFETSWNFRCHPLVFKYLVKGISLEESFKKWNELSVKRFNDVKKNEESLNELFNIIYGVQDEIASDVDEKDITIRKADLSSDIRSLISYAVGCMFGRYSLDEEGLIYAGGTWNSQRYKTFIPVEDGIIPITDEEYFQNDIVTRFVEFIKAVYGEETLEENLDYIAQALGNKGDTSREIIRNYFINDFYKDHCNTYSVAGSGKRPIYWLFDSGKQNGFKALIYMHRYTRDTVGIIRSDYLHKVQDALDNSLKNAEYIINTSTSAVDKAQAKKARNKYMKQLNETRVYHQALSHIALQRIEIDLDDGVKHNYQLFQGVEISSEGNKKQTIDLLAKIK